jgi:hypothetical protein
MAKTQKDRLAEALALLELHYEAFYSLASIATETGHPVPMDTRGWSQILVSVLTGVRGLERQKGADLADGSDVKAANTWLAIDTPRFNGVLKAGTQSLSAGRIESLDSMPHLYFVLWDTTERETWRCRIWVVQPQIDEAFREMARSWYLKRETGEIISTNFQLHPPRGLDTNIIRNTCGNLVYPLYFLAERAAGHSFELLHFDPEARSNGACTPA